MTTLTVRLPVDLIGDLRHVAEIRGQTVSEVARNAFERERQLAAHDVRLDYHDREQQRRVLDVALTRRRRLATGS